jgi:hypothetical protein
MERYAFERFIARTPDGSAPAAPPGAGARGPWAAFAITIVLPLLAAAILFALLRSQSPQAEQLRGRFGLSEYGATSDPIIEIPES